MEKVPTLTLPDVANLAGVRRSVVSMWRRRPQVHGRHLPFPPPSASVNGVERFDRDAIVAWLEETGRGKNPEVRQDAPSLAVPDGVDLDAVTALLALHVLTGAELSGLGPMELTELAVRADPDDRLLRREIGSIRTSQPLLRYVDDLTEGSYGAPDALARLESGRLARATAERGLSDELGAMVEAVVTAARHYLADGAVALAPPDDPRLARRLAAGFAGVLVDGADEAARVQRRRAAIAGVEVLTDAEAAVRVLSLVGRPEPDALEAVDELVVSLGRSDVGVVLGAAAALCDPLVGDAERRRSQTLRSGTLALAVRLPRGLWKAAHRQSLALWVLDGARDAPDLRLADLDSGTVDLNGLAADVTAALERSDGRAYQYARRADLAPILAGGPVVPRGVRAVRIETTEPAVHVDRIRAATVATSVPIDGYDLAVASASGRVVLRQRSLAELINSGQLISRAGRRIDRAHADPAGTVRVLAADGSMDDVRLDPFDARQLYPRASWTEPGDVVISERPPVARVDTIGGALVATPSRILRLGPGAPVGPNVLATLITELAPARSEWPTWTVPDLPREELDCLDAALAAATDHLALLRRREAVVRDLVRNLIDGVAAGAVTIVPTQEG